MRGDDRQPQSGMFSYVALEDRIPADHPLRGVKETGGRGIGRDVQGLRGTVLEGRTTLDSAGAATTSAAAAGFLLVWSERLLMEQLNYNLLFRWFVGLEIDGPVWSYAVFSKNRDRLLDQDLAQRRPCESAGGRANVGRALHGGWDADRGLGWAEELSLEGR